MSLAHHCLQLEEKEKGYTHLNKEETHQRGQNHISNSDPTFSIPSHKLCWALTARVSFFPPNVEDDDDSTYYVAAVSPTQTDTWNTHLAEMWILMVSHLQIHTSPTSRIYSNINLCSSLHALYTDHLTGSCKTIKFRSNQYKKNGDQFLPLPIFILT